MIATERLYLTADRRAVVKPGDEAAAFLLVNKGGVIPDALAKQLGLLAAPDKIADRAVRVPGNMRER